MKKTLTLFLVMTLFTVSACAPQVTAASTLLPAAFMETQVPSAVSPTEMDQFANLKLYTNSVFGLGFKYPSNWFGPDEYVSGQDLRVAVGSDIVYPYGTVPEQPSEVRNSYYVVIQYSRNNQNQYWKDTYQSLLKLKDGESSSDARSLIIRVGQFKVGRFEGIEYITTLSETAQTEPVYIRQTILFDNQSNLLTIMGQPNNVEISNGTGWRDAYRMVDEANLAIFHEIVESITIE
jgi:hypothetical protein